MQKQKNGFWRRIQEISVSTLMGDRDITMRMNKKCIGKEDQQYEIILPLKQINQKCDNMFGSVGQLYSYIKIEQNCHINWMEKYIQILDKDQQICCYRFKEEDASYDRQKNIIDQATDLHRQIIEKLKQFSKSLQTKIYDTLDMDLNSNNKQKEYHILQSKLQQILRNNFESQGDILKEEIQKSFYNFSNNIYEDIYPNRNEKKVPLQIMSQIIEISDADNSNYRIKYIQIHQQNAHKKKDRYQQISIGNNKETVLSEQQQNKRKGQLKNFFTNKMERNQIKFLRSRSSNIIPYGNFMRFQNQKCQKKICLINKYIQENTMIKRCRIKINSYLVFIGIGIINIDYLYSRFQGIKKNWVYYRNDGRVWDGFNTWDNQGKKFRSGDIVQIQVNYRTKQVQWKVDRQIRHSVNCQKLNLQQSAWVPFIYFYNKNDSVEILPLK